MQTIDKHCPKNYEAKPDYQGCPYCGAQLIKEMVTPFQVQGYYRCSWCQAAATIAEFDELRRD